MCIRDRYEVVITTHLNTRHYHNHIVWNSVSMADGPLSDCMDDGLIKDIQIEDWLRREPVQVDVRKITAHIEGYLSNSLRSDPDRWFYSIAPS